MFPASFALDDRNSVPQKVALVLVVVAFSDLAVRPAVRFKRYQRTRFLSALPVRKVIEAKLIPE